MRQRDELELLRWRISFLGYVIIAVLVTLAFGFWQHQIAQSPKYALLAEQNRVREVKLIAQRGRIYDRNHKLLADNRPSFNIVLMREDSPHTVEQTAGMLAQGIDMSVADLMDRINRKKREPKFRPIILKEDVPGADIAYVRAHQYELPEIRVEQQPRRRYPGGEVLAHALGYVGEVTEAQLATPEFLDTKSGDIVGKAGLERQYNSILRGKDGYKRIIVNSFGREMGQLESEEPIPGNDLNTTLDLDLQQAAEAAIGDHTGAVVALDPHTGEILALMSKPSFDPNLFASRISSIDWDNIINDPRKPLQNRVVQSRYSPGSVFKVFMAAAGLEAHTLNPLESYYCPGHATFYGRTFSCDKKEGHGHLSLHDAIVNSCNVFFYNVGNELGIDRISSYATMMGLGRKTGVDLPNEDSGLIPSSEWKERVLKTKWYAGETISVAIGQGYVAITPMQAAWAMGGLAIGGRLRQPHLVSPEALQRVGFPAPELHSEDYPIHEETVNIVTSAMWGVVNEGGTGARARIEGFDVAGKTGTAQVVAKQYYNKDEFQDNAWFVGFAPYRNPQIVVAAFIENGGFGGIVAAPVVHAVMQKYVDTRNEKFEEDKANAIAMKD